MTRILIVLIVMVVGMALGQTTIGPVDPSKTYENVNKYGERDLDIQTRMADATDTSKIWGMATGFLTIFVSGLALFFSIRQSKAAHRQSQQELMAYVYPSRVQILGVADHTWRGDGKPYTMGLDISLGTPVVEGRITFKNSGQTPAFDFYHLGTVLAHKPWFVVSKKMGKRWLEGQGAAFQSKAVIPPNGEITVSFKTEIKIVRSNKLLSGQEYLYLQGVIKYATLGKRVDTSYRYVRINKDDSVAGGCGMEIHDGEGVWVCEGGNTTQVGKLIDKHRRPIV